MITEDYVSFEVAKLLKEKGFNIKPFHQYYVSSCGKVFGCTGNEMKQETTNRGYKRISLSINGKHERWSIHRLVALLFIPNPEQKLEVNHIDGNKENNDVSNLEWCSRSENEKHAHLNGLKRNMVKGRFGKDHIASRPFVCVETGKIYNCQRELAEELGGGMEGVSHITRACKYGLLDHGFHWRYYEPNELVKLLLEKGYNKYPLSYDGDYWFCYVQMAMKWLRNVHNKHCYIGYDIDLKQFFQIIDLKETVEYDYPETKYYHTENETGFNSYEEAIEEALKYSLENLI